MRSHWNGWNGIGSERIGLHRSQWHCIKVRWVALHRTSPDSTVACKSKYEIGFSSIREHPALGVPPGGNEVDGLRKARFSRLQFIPHPLGEDGMGGLGGNRCREIGGVPTTAHKSGPKSSMKKDTKKDTKKSSKGYPKNHKHVIRADFLRVLEGT